VPLLFDEETTRTLVSLVTADPMVLVSFVTPVELASAITRRVRDTREARPIFDALENGWTVIDDYERILRRARSLAVRYGLRSGDAIQLSSAIEADTDGTRAMPFICLDQELLAAARAEGFPTLP